MGPDPLYNILTTTHKHYGNVGGTARGRSADRAGRRPQRRNGIPRITWGREVIWRQARRDNIGKRRERGSSGGDKGRFRGSWVLEARNYIAI